MYGAAGFLPVVGAITNANDAIDHYNKGDYGHAAVDVASALTSPVKVVDKLLDVEHLYRYGHNALAAKTAAQTVPGATGLANDYAGFTEGELQALKDRDKK